MPPRCSTSESIRDVVRDLDEAVLDVKRGAALGRAVLVEHGVVGVAAGGLAGLAVERRREEQRLPVRRAQRDDAVERRAEAHVEHAVGLVDHERAHVVEREGAALELVLEPAGGGDDDVGPGGGLGLLEEADTAVDGGDAERAGVSDRPQLVDDLGGELTRGGEDERRGAARLGGRAVDHRDAEGERLAGAGGGAGEHVATGEHVADHRRAGLRTARRSAVAASASTTALDTPRSAKDCWDMCSPWRSQ